MKTGVIAICLTLVASLAVNPVARAAEADLPVMQANPAWSNWTDVADPFVNIINETSGWSARRNRPHQDDVMDFEAMLAGGFIDPVTMLPTAIPPGYDYVQSSLFRRGSRTYPDYYAGDYVVEWEGDADVNFGLSCSNRQTKQGQRRVVTTCTSGDSWGFVAARRIGEGGLKDIRVFRAEDEDLIRAGVVWTPKYIDHLKGYSVIRDLDIQHSTYSGVTGAHQNTPYSSKLWGMGADVRSDPAAPKSPPLQAIFELANETDSALWHVMPPMLGPEKDWREIYGSSNRNTAAQAYARENGAAIIASESWRAYADHIVASMIAAGYPEDRPVYLELGNEVWNFGNPFGFHTYYFWGLGEHLKDSGLATSGEAFRWALGYMTARMAVEIDAAMIEAGRGSQPVVFVLAGQMAYLARTEWALRGFNAYFEQTGRDRAPFISRLGVSTASYYSGQPFDRTKGFFPAETDAERNEKWLAAIKADPDGLARRLTDYIIDGPDDHTGTLPWGVKNRAEHQRIAESHGAFFLGDYEGHDHLSAISALRDDPDYVRWLDEWRHGPEGARMTHAWVAAMHGQNPNAIISNFHTVGSRLNRSGGISAPWVDGMWGEETERLKAFDAYLKRE